MAIEPWIETFSGKRMYFLDPKPEMICIEDIAHALSNICRFGGHCVRFYSVAEHSINVSSFSNNALEGLLHDASEAYLIDIPKPIKEHLLEYKEIERKLMAVIAEKYGFSWPESEDTKDADTVMLKIEAMQLLGSGGRNWLHNFPTERSENGYPPLAFLSPRGAKLAFLQRFNALTVGRLVP